jgi:hypothetical protein
MIIVGAGLAGLLAAHAWPAAPVFESAPEPSAAHKALLRFRSDAVARLTGIEFRPVTVRKGIWYNERYVQPDIQLANMYAVKVTGSLSGDRSIWSLEPVTRFIAPEDFYEQLIAAVGPRIKWACPFDFELRNEFLRSGKAEAIVSTAPMPLLLKLIPPPAGYDLPEFRKAPIRVARYRVAQCDVHQTVYFPSAALKIYRASITGSLLIIESMVSGITDHAHPKSVPQHEFDDTMSLQQACHAFGLDQAAVEPMGTVEQRYGKIVPLNDALRKQTLFWLSQQYGIYSLGRFATWRNVLLDDVVKDIDVVRKLLKSSPYDSHLIQKG